MVKNCQQINFLTVRHTSCSNSWKWDRGRSLEKAVISIYTNDFVCVPNLIFAGNLIVNPQNDKEMKTYRIHKGLPPCQFTSSYLWTLYIVRTSYSLQAFFNSKKNFRKESHSYYVHCTHLKMLGKLCWITVQRLCGDCTEIVQCQCSCRAVSAASARKSYEAPPPPPHSVLFRVRICSFPPLKAPPYLRTDQIFEPPFAGFSQAFPASKTPLNPEHCSMYPLYLFYNPLFKFLRRPKRDRERERERKTTPFLKKSPGEKSNPPPFFFYNSRGPDFVARKVPPLPEILGNTHAVPPTPGVGGAGYEARSGIGPSHGARAGIVQCQVCIANNFRQVRQSNHIY